MFAAVICFTTATAATIIPSDQLLGAIRPGTPANAENEMRMVQFLITELNSGPSNPVAYAGGAYTTGVSLGDNPNDPQTEAYYLWAPNGLTVPAADPLLGFQTTTSNTTISLGASTYQYLIAKFGQNSVAFWIGNLSGDIEIPNLFPGDQNPQLNGLSHYTLMNPGRTTTNVPDGGVTIGLLGLAMAALLPLHKRLTRSTGES